jgi:natural product biosynthesis luciferase-like monooxygenase protein
MDLSVMFFGAGAPAAEAGDAAGYEDVLAIAREADRLGFRALWTPERHFQGVGQAFPNPALLGAALTVATERIEIRAGSAVLPLHHPVRVVEDWAVLDNLGRGRIGLSVATGWHSADFVLAPERFADRRRHAIEAVETIRRLWAGEPVELPDGLGRRVAVLPRPRPYSPALPLWLTSSGSAETWLTAARLRANVLSATSGRDREELATLIEDYRAAYAAAPPLPNTPERGTVTVMAHAYIG